MRRNLVLFFICLGIGIFAYYTQEYLPNLSNSGGNSFLAKYDVGVPKIIKTNKITLERRENGFWIQKLDLPADRGMVRKFFESLEGLQALEEIEESKITKLGQKNFFPEDDYLELSFDNQKSVRLQIGKKLNYARGFYAKVTFLNSEDLKNTQSKEVKYFVLEDQKALVGMYNEKDYKNSNEHYLKIVGLLYLDSSFFIPKDLGGFLSKAAQEKNSIAAMKFNSTSSKAFRINLNKKSIEPEILENITIDLKKMDQFLKDFFTLRAKWAGAADNVQQKKYFEGTSELEDFKQEVSLLDAKNKVVFRLRFFKNTKPDNAAEIGDYIVWNDRWPFYQIFSKEDGLKLFVHHQDFYNKRPAIDPKKVKVNLSATTLDPNGLLNYLQEKADWLSNIDKLDKLSLIKKIGLLEDGNQLFSLFQNENDLILVDEQKKLKYHYYRGATQLKLQK